MLLTVQEMQNRLSQLKYNGWTMEVREGFKEGPHFIAKASVPDTFNVDKMVNLEIHSPIPPQVSEASFDLFVSWRMCRAEIHESMEKLQVDGKPLFDPHRQFADRDEYENNRVIPYVPKVDMVTLGLNVY